MIDIIFLAIALSLDAAIIAFSYGLILKPYRIHNGIKLAFVTGFFQAFMPAVGYLISLLAHESLLGGLMDTIDHWISFVIFLLLGIKVIKDSWGEEKEEIENKLSWWILLMIGIATSIDALAAGIIVFTQNYSFIDSVILIGGITFVLVFVAFLSSRFFQSLPTLYLGLTGGIILIGLGIKVLYEHLVI